MARVAEFTDNFNRVNQTLETSSDWNNITGGATITSNEVDQTTTAVVSEYLISTASSDANCYAQYVATGTTTNVPGHGIILRADASLTSGYLVYFRRNSSDILGYRRDGGSWTLLGTIASSVTLADNDVLVFECTGTGATVTLEAFVNGVSQGTIDDTSGSRDVAAGRAGIRLYDTDEQLDNFEAGILNDALAAEAVTVSEEVRVSIKNTGASPYSQVYEIVIDNTKVYGSDEHTNFPMLVKGTYAGAGSDPDLRTTGNGGDIQNTATGGVNGILTVPADLAFYDDVNASNQLSHEVTRYNATTGEFIAWVKVPYVSPTADTSIFMHFSDVSVTVSQEDVAGTWTDDYLNVVHFNEPGGTDANNSGDDGSTYFDETGTPDHQQTGQIDYAFNFDGTSENVFVHQSSTAQDEKLEAVAYDITEITQSFWLYTDTVSASPLGTYLQSPLVDSDANALLSTRHNFDGGTENLYYILTGTPSNVLNNTTNLTTGAWHYVTMTWKNNVGGYIFIDGSEILTPSTLNGTGIATSASIGSSYTIGGYKIDGGGASSQYYDGKIDEGRTVTTAHTLGWHQTEYANQNSPSTFYSVSNALDTTISISVSDSVTVSESVSSSVTYIIIYDQFTGSNGDNITGRTPDTISNGNVYLDHQQDALGSNNSGKIQDNQAQIINNNSGFVIDADNADVHIQVLWTPAVGVPNRNSVIFRRTDNENYLYFNIREENGDWQLYKLVANSGSLIDNGSYSWNEGQTYQLDVILSGNNITCYIDTVSVTSQSDSFNNTATQHGLHRNTGDSATRFDDFIITGDLSAPTLPDREVSVSDSTTVSENISLDITTSLPPLNLSVSDSVTVSESVSVFKDWNLTTPILDQFNVPPTVNDGNGLRFNTNFEELAFSWTPTYSGYITEWHSWLSLYGTVTGNMWVTIYDDNAVEPGTQIGGDSVHKDVNTITSTNDYLNPTEETFTWTDNYPQVTASTTYWLVFKGDFTFSSSNYVATSSDNTGTDATNGQSQVKRWNGSAWVASSTAYTFFEQYYSTSAAPLEVSVSDSVTVSENVSVSSPTSFLEVNLGGTTFVNEYTYRRSVVVDNTQVSGTSNISNFMFMFRETNNDFKTTANGGLLENGFDFAFYSDASGTTQLSHEIATHNYTTGEVVAWVKIPSLDYNDDTTIYLFYGKTGVTDQSDPTNAWSDYISVYHNNEADGTQPQDSLGNKDFNTTLGNPTEQQTGQIDDAVNFLAGNNAFYNPTQYTHGSDASAISVGAWIYTTAVSAAPLGTYLQIPNQDTGAGVYMAFRHYSDAGTPRIRTVIESTPGNNTHDTGTVSTGEWHYVVGTAQDNGFAYTYVDGVQSGSFDGSSNTLRASANVDPSMGAYVNSGSGSQWYNGLIDEVWVRFDVADPDRIATEFNNQSAPGTFYTLGTAVEGGGGEEVAVTESVSLDINFGNNVQLSASDSTTVSENVSVYINEPALTVSVSDSITVSEAVSVNEPYFTNIEISIQEQGSFANGWAAKRLITLDEGITPSNPVTNVPFRFAGTYTYLKSASNGGLVNSESGYDIMFTSDSDGLVELDKETVVYEPATGYVEIYVRIPSWTPTSDYTFYIWYGNSLVTTSNDNAAGVWQDYVAVYHLTEQGDGTAGEYVDSTGNGNDATAATGIGIPTRGTGSGNFKYHQDFSNDAIDIPQLGQFDSWMMSVWTNPDTLSTTQMALGADDTGQTKYAVLGYGIATATKTDRTGYAGGRLTNRSGGTTGVWDYLVYEWNSSTQTADSLRLVLNGNLTSTFSGSSGYYIADVDMWMIGTNQKDPTNWDFDGKITEVRIAEPPYRAWNPSDYYQIEYRVTTDFNTWVTIGAEQRSTEIQVFESVQIEIPNLAGEPSVSDSTTVSENVNVTVFPPDLNLSVSDSTSVTDTPSVDEPRFATLQIHAAEPDYTNGFALRRKLEVNHTAFESVSTAPTQEFVPVHIYGTFDYLATKENGGELFSANAYDILFTDYLGNTIDHYIEDYDPSTGQIFIVVNVPDVNGNYLTTNTEFYMYYSKFGVSDPTDSTGAWKMFNAWTDDTPTYAISFENNAVTEKARNLATTATNNITYSTGKLGTAAFFDGSTSYATVSDHVSMNGTDENFISGWFYFNSNTQGVDVSVLSKIDSNPIGWIFGKDSADRLFLYRTYLEEVGNTYSFYTPTYTVAFDTWIHIIVWNANTGNQPSIYVNGLGYFTQPDINYTITQTNAEDLYIGGDSLGQWNKFEGGIDQLLIGSMPGTNVRIRLLSSAIRSTTGNPSNFTIFNDVDGLPVTEAIVLEDFTRPISVSENVTVTDTPTIFIEQPTPTPSVSDTVTVTEEIDIFFGALFPTIVASDSLVVIESWYVNMGNPNTLVTDTVTVSESVNFSIYVPPHELSVSDTISVSDIPNVQPPNVTIPIQSETVTVSESIDVQRFFYFTASESTIVTDVSSVVMEDLRVVAGENVQVIEGIGGSTALDMQTSETITVADQFTAVIPIELIRGDLTIVLDQTFDLEMVSYLNVSESISVSEAVEFVQVFEIKVSESITVTDTAQIQPPVFRINKSELVNVNESLTAIVREPPDFKPINTETITVTEGIISIAVLDAGALGISVKDTVSVSDIHNVVIPFPGIQVSDSVTVTDTPSAVTPTVLFVNVNDNIIVNDIFTPDYVDIVIPPASHSVYVYEVTVVTESWTVDRDIWGGNIPDEEGGIWNPGSSPTTTYKEIDDPTTDWKDADEHER